MTPTRPLLVALLIVGAALVAGCGSEGPSTTATADGGIRISDATIDWPANPEVGAVRLLVHNDGPRADELVGASSDVATSTMVHRSVTDAQGRARMEMVSGLEIPARSTVTFEPGGLHVMLNGLTRELEVGDRVEVTMIFRDAGPVSATATVVEPGTASLGGDAAEEAAHDH
ncbi:MAG: copper chaperone PCu(A)C [Acidimicrobiales bacterium]|nr:copper chaperone PCu(A)C [Acidimicrobiales bacterium]HRW38059.1 copper chaperone PCu(A)C [Aquihabitans sp.]